MKQDNVGTKIDFTPKMKRLFDLLGRRNLIIELKRQWKQRVRRNQSTDESELASEIEAFYDDIGSMVCRWLDETKCDIKVNGSVCTPGVLKALILSADIAQNVVAFDIMKDLCDKKGLGRLDTGKDYDVTDMEYEDGLDE